VPAKSFRAEAPDDKPTYSEQGAYESLIVGHVACEIAIGIAQAQTFGLPWLNKWGTSVTLTITAEDQSGINPGVSLVTPLRNVIRTFPSGGNVNLSQSFSLGLGASGAATATRTETIQFTYLNSDLLTLANNYPSCDKLRTGAQMDGDLQIRQFIFDKALIAKSGNASLFDKTSVGFKQELAGKPKPLVSWQWPVFNTFTEEINFVAAYGGNITPSWKLATITADTAGSLVSAERTYTNDLIITVGPLGGGVPSETQPIALSTGAQNQHNARVQGNAIATSIQSQQH
jgi:hypothetical protein